MLDSLDEATLALVFAHSRDHADVARVARVCKMLHARTKGMCRFMLLRRAQERLPAIAELPRSRKIARMQRAAWGERSTTKLLRELAPLASGTASIASVLRALSHTKAVATVGHTAVSLEVFWQALPGSLPQRLIDQALNPREGVLYLHAGEAHAIFTPRRPLDMVSVILVDEGQGWAIDGGLPWLEHTAHLPFTTPTRAPAHLTIRLAERQYIPPFEVYSGETGAACRVGRVEAGEVDVRDIVHSVKAFGTAAGAIYGEEGAMAFASWASSIRGTVVTFSIDGYANRMCRLAPAKACTQ